MSASGCAEGRSTLQAVVVANAATTAGIISAGYQAARSRPRRNAADGGNDRRRHQRPHSRDLAETPTSGITLGHGFDVAVHAINLPVQVLPLAPKMRE